jgi:hypothetical protein
MSQVSPGNVAAAVERCGTFARLHFEPSAATAETRGEQSEQVRPAMAAFCEFAGITPNAYDEMIVSAVDAAHTAYDDPYTPEGAARFDGYAHGFMVGVLAVRAAAEAADAQPSHEPPDPVP